MLCNVANAEPSPFYREDFGHIDIYGGPYEIAYREINRWLLNEYDAWTDKLYNGGQINTWEYNHRYNRIRDLLSLPAGYFGTRPFWWLNLPESKGGAPRNLPARRWGHTYKVINNGLFSLTNSVDFKWKTLKATIDVSKKKIDWRNIKNWSGNGWKFGLSPKLQFTISGRSIESMFKTVGIGFYLSYYIRGIKIFLFRFTIRYNSAEREIYSFFSCSLAQW